MAKSKQHSDRRDNNPQDKGCFGPKGFNKKKALHRNGKWVPGFNKFGEPCKLYQYS